MMTINYLKLDWKTTLKRYFLMMALVIIGVLAHVWIVAFLALPVFLSAILGIEVKVKKEERKVAKMKVIHRDTTKKAM